MLIHLDLFPIFISFFVAILLLVVMTPLAHHLGLVDHPSIRKQHIGLVPLTGGVAIFMAVLAASFLTDVWLENYPLFFTASAFIILLGILDDRFTLSSKGRLLCQFGVAMIMVWSAQNHINNLGNLIGIGDVQLGYFGYCFTLVCVVGVINSFNMIDGIDGLAGAVSLVALVSVVILLMISNNGSAIMVPMLIIAALIPFMAFNLSIKGFKGNKIFMGDSGSMFIGLAIAWFLVEYTQGAEAAMRPITAVWLVGLPLADMAAIMLRRARKGQSVLQADRRHLHNICLRLGLSSYASLLFITAIGICFASVGILGEVLEIPEHIMFCGFVIALAGYMFVIHRIWVIVRSYRRWIVKKQS